MAVMSLRAYARHRGVSIRAVQKAIAANRITTTADKKIDPVRADAEWQRNTNPKEQINMAPRPERPERPAAKEQPAPAGVTDQAPRAIAGDSYHKARAAREGYAARLAQIEYEQKIGKLVDRAAVEAEAFNRYRTFRDLILNIPDRIAPIIAAESDTAKVHEILEAEIRTALNDFSNASTAPISE